MTTPLPEQPDLGQLKRQAKTLLKAYKAGDADARAAVDAHFPGADSRTFALHHAQLVIAREHGFESWARLRQAVRERLLEDFLAAVRRDDVDRAVTLTTDFPEYANTRVVGGCSVLDPDAWRARCAELRDAGLWTQEQVAEYTREDHTCTPIHYCAIHGRSEMAKVLLDAGADPNARGYEGSNSPHDNGYARPLSLAAWEGDLATMRVLLQHGADPNGEDGLALSTVLRHRGREYAAKSELLLNSGTTMTFEAAVTFGLFLRMRAMLKRDPSRAVRRLPGGQMPMDAAANSGSPEAARLLEAHGASVSFVQACGLGMRENVLAALLEDPEAVSRVQDNDLPLMRAAIHGRIDLTRDLLACGADVNGELREGKRAINIAHPWVIDILAKAGADMNHVHRGYTPLMRGLAGGWPHGEERAQEKVDALVRHGGVGRFYMVGTSPRHVDYAERMLDLGADVNEADEDGRTALDHAIAHRARAEGPDAQAFDRIIEILKSRGGRSGT